MTLRVLVALIAALGIGALLLTSNPNWAVAIIAAYVTWMFLRDSRRNQGRNRIWDRP